MYRTNEDLCREFHILMKKEYPDITLQQLKDVCTAPWKMLSNMFKKGPLEEVRIKYFGSFKVYKGSAEAHLRRLKIKFDRNEIEPEIYFKKKKELEQFIENYDK